MKIKQLMLGTACAALAATGVQAADLSQPEAAAADYVRVCNAHGAGFFYIPGTETCMRIKGRVRVEYGASSIDSKLTKAEKRMKDRMTFVSKAYIYVDARTELDSGPLKTFFEYQMGNSSPAKAYISGLGGFTMGKAGSRYDFKTGYSYGTVGYKVSDVGGAIVLAYNASLGNGLSLDFSIEDGKSRQNGGNYGGLELPDFVGALTMSQGSVTAKLSGALHQNRSSNASVSTKIGYGVSGGAEVDLGAAKVAMQAQYTIGATSYAGFGNDDFSVVAGKIKQNRAWSVWGGLEVGLGDGLTSYTDLSYGKFDDKGNKANDYTFWSVSETIEASLGAGMVVGGDIGYSSTKTRGLKRKNVFAGKVRFQQTF